VQQQDRRGIVRPRDLSPTNTIPSTLVAAMKKGERAVIRVAAPNNQVVGLPLSLMGFTKAMNTLSR